MSGYKPYPKYKESGVEWLGTLPDHWNVRKIKHNTYLKGRVGWKGLTSDEFLTSGYAYLVTGTDFQEKYIRWENCYCVEKDRYDDDPFIQLKNGDLLITKDGTIGKTALVCELTKPACLNSGIFLIRPESEYLTDYLYWILNSKSFSYFCDLSSMGSTIQHLYQNVFETFSFPIPNISEQNSIAKFLDRETSRIDSLIQEQRELIELLKEKRQAVISNAVTKGLNPKAKMKDSGVEWIGEIPENWEVRKLKYLIESIESGVSVNSIDTPANQNEMGVLKTSCVYGNVFNKSENKCVDDPNEISRLSCPLQSNSIVVSRMNTPDLVGACGYVQEGDIKIFLPDRLWLVKFNQMILPKFAWITLTENRIRSIIGVLATGTSGSMKNLSQEDFRNIPMPLPNLQTQESIISFIDKELYRISAMIEGAESAIELMQEHRASLISEAVTGKIDVRGINVK